MKRLVFAVILLLGVQPLVATPRTFDLDVVFLTYVGNATHWTDPATKGAELIKIDNDVWHGSASLGQITLTGSTRPGWLDLDIAPVNGAFGSGQMNCTILKDYALSKLPPIPGNTIRVLVVPPGTPCYSQEYGVVGPLSGATVVTVGGASIDHETGHALGLPHTFEQHCATTNGVVSCQNVERGGYSLMGQGQDTSVHERIMLGAFSPTYSLVTATTSQDVTLQFANTMARGVKGIAVPQVLTVKKPLGPFGTVATQDHTVYIEYRRDSDPSRSGVILWLASDNLMDLDRATTAARRRLNLGETFCEVQTCVTLLNATQAPDPGTTGTATVRIAIGGAGSYSGRLFLLRLYPCTSASPNASDSAEEPDVPRM